MKSWIHNLTCFYARTYFNKSVTEHCIPTYTRWVKSVNTPYELQVFSFILMAELTFQFLNEGIKSMHEQTWNYAGNKSVTEL